MQTSKQTVRAMLDELPDDVSFEDIQYKLYVHSKMEKGIADFEAGRTIDHSEVERRMSEWFAE